MSITTRMPNIPEEQITPVVAQLLAIIELQIEEIQLLKDEIARLKGQKPRPKIKPSILQNQKRSAKKKKGGKRAKKSKTKKLEIHQVISIAPDHIPTGSTFKGYQDYTVQDRDKTLDFQPMHLDTAIVGPQRQEVRICSQTDPLPLPH